MNATDYAQLKASVEAWVTSINFTHRFDKIWQGISLVAEKGDEWGERFSPEHRQSALKFGQELRLILERQALEEYEKYEAEENAEHERIGAFLEQLERECEYVELTGVSDRQVSYGEHCRYDALNKLASEVAEGKISLQDALRLIAQKQSAKYWIEIN